MNNREKKMLDIIRQGKDEFGYVGIKAEFEAEGTRPDELLRLIEISHKAGVNIAIKIGGCEAITDLLETRQLGVDYIIAPMIESPYALSKYIDAKNKVYTPEERQDTKFLFNLETIESYNRLDGLVNQAVVPSGADGIVFGRVDFASSIGLSKENINSEKITDYVLEVTRACREKKLEMVVGGGVSMDSLPVLAQMAKVGLTRFETRKILFSSDALDIKNISKGLLQAVHFELLWLQNKKEYYSLIQKEDDARIKMLDARWKVLNNQ